VRALLSFFRTESCSHQFSWPRVLGDGRHYQTCLVCGAEYEYDWQRMRRGARIEEEAAKPARGFRRIWKPRARRIKRDLVLHYRVMGWNEWHRGRIQDVSQSGIFFRTMSPLRINQRLEMVFEMPAEILGAEGQKVIAVGCIVRCAVVRGEKEAEPTAEGNGASGPLGLTAATNTILLAANIWDYTLLSESYNDRDAEPVEPPRAQQVSPDPYC
jgi:hypothetical protein